MKRGRPFEPGNKFGRGRPRGSRNQSALTQKLLDEHAPALLRKALVLALQGDSATLRILLSHILPRPKDPPVRIGPLPMGSAEELLQARESLMKKVASGQLTPHEAQPIDSLIEGQRRIIETHVLDKRLRALEQFHEKDQDKAA